MVRPPRRSTSPSAEPYGGHGHAHNFVAGIQIIQYRSYQRDIFIYHVREHLLSMHLIRRALQSQKEYRDRLTSFDPVCNFPVVDGDKIPSGCIEAAYMPSVLHNAGSALALRSNKEAGKVEWLIFSEPIHDDFLTQIIFSDGNWGLQSNLDPCDARKVFNLVGYAEKGLKARRVRGANNEHKGWHDSLCAAEPGKVRLKLTWKRYGDELKAHHERRRREAEEAAEEAAEENAEETDESSDEEDDQMESAGVCGPSQQPQKPLTRRKV